MIRSLLLSALLLAPSAAFACGMPMSVARSRPSLTEALQEVDSAKPAPVPAEVVVVPEAPAPVEPAPAPAPTPAPTS